VGDFAIHLSQINDAVKAAIPDAAFKAMEHLRQVSVSKAPIETGNLRGSAEVKPHPDGAEVYYPGPYARFQHFELQLRHEHGGQALYLEQPVVQETPRILEICAEELRKAIE
jgi:hypothetical protein